MHTVRLKISGFRGVHSADIALGRNVVRVGPNNSGKTIIIEAQALLFGRDRLVRRLGDRHCLEIVVEHRISDFATLGTKVMHYGRYDQSIRTLAAP